MFGGFGVSWVCCSGFVGQSDVCLVDAGPTTNGIELAQLHIIFFCQGHWTAGSNCVGLVSNPTFMTAPH